MIWERTKESLKETLTHSLYQLWIEPLDFVELKGDRFYLKTPDRYFSTYVKQHFSQVILDKLHDCGLEGVDIVFCESKQHVSEVKKTVASEDIKPKGPKVQMRLPNIPKNNSRYRSLHPKYTFEQFMVGQCNILAQSACRSMAVDGDGIGPCLFINSDTGLGKSHLTHAVAHQILVESPMTRLHYLTAKQFAAEMVQGIQTRTMEDFKNKYHNHCDILLVEDIHSLTGKKKTQEELNDILDSLIKSGKRVIMTANGTPRDLEGIDNEFRSRMTSGLVTSIAAPGIDTRARIVRNKAGQQKLNLDEDLILYLAQHIRGDIRRIESALISVRAKAALNGGQVDMDLIREVVGSVVGVGSVLTTEMVCDLVSSQFKVPVKDLQSKSRKKEITIPRQIAMYLARKHTEQSLQEIGKVFRRDHSTVLHSIKVVSSKLVRDASVNAQLQLLSDKVQQL